MSYLKLAYLAEFAVAFNLAFGEWKHEKIAKEMDIRFESLDKNCEVQLAELIKSLDDRTLRGERSEYLDHVRTWKGRCVTWLDRLRRHRMEPAAGDRKYNPLRQFFERAALFSTSPQSLEKNNGHYTKLCIFRNVLTGSIMGLLASWVYSKTPTWKHPPCPSSRILWTLLVAISIVMTLSTADSGKFSFDAFFLGTVISFPVPAFPYFFVAVGALAGLLTPRPFSAAGSFLIGRYPPVPRGRYYHFALVCLVTIILIGITLLDSDPVKNNFEIIPSEALWMYLFGFLLIATIMPILLFTGYLFLETSIDNWTKWTEGLARQVADEGIKTLRKAQVSPSIN